MARVSFCRGRHVGRRIERNAAMGVAGYSGSPMAVQIDPSIKRHEIEGFKFPLGAYPVEEMTPKPGYSALFEQADGGGDEDDWEEWPDRYVYDVVLSAERVPALCRTLFSKLPEKVYPILDVLGHDAFREVDPFMAYDTIGLDVFLDGVREYGPFLYEDGMVGFGVMCEEPFLYIFVDEHKILTIRCAPEIRERIEKVLQAFDLEQTEDAAGCDAAAHEHRNVLVAPSDRADLLTAEEAVEHLRDAWRLLLNIDPDTNLDETGNEIGTTTWRSVVRCHFEVEPSKQMPQAKSATKGVRYAEVVFDADNLRQAEDVGISAVEALCEEGKLEASDYVMVAIDRIPTEVVRQVLEKITETAEEKAGSEKAGGEKSKNKPAPRNKRGAKKEDDSVFVPLAGTVHGCHWLD
jgi:hypothetical protein